MEPTARPSKYAPELRERAVRMVHEHAHAYPFVRTVLCKDTGHQIAANVRRAQAPSMPEGRGAGGAKRRALTAPSTATSCEGVMALDRRTLSAPRYPTPTDRELRYL